MIIGIINKQVAVFDNHILKKAVEKIVQSNSFFFVEPKLIIDFSANLWCKLLFSNPVANKNPPNNKKTTGLAYFDKISFNIIGWQNIDIYQNLVITYLFDVEVNKEIKKNGDIKKFDFKTLSHDEIGKKINQIDHVGQRTATTK